MTFYICFGENGGFKFEKNKRVLRLVLFYVSIAIVKYDIEVLIDRAIEIVGSERHD